ncbi:MAG: DUF4344 domain-containing metallopeptidase [Candidatus Hydrothermarchaeales archaeon]
MSAINRLVFSLVLILILSGCLGGEEPVDSDNDGLTDEEEAVLKTNPYQADSDGDGISDKEDPNPMVSSKKIPSTEPVTKGLDRGDIYVEYFPTDNPDFQIYEDLLKNWETFEIISTGYSKVFSIPMEEGLPIYIGECGTINAFYDPNEKFIAMCYELMKFIDDMGFNLYEDSKSQNMHLLSNLFFIFNHEFGHALIDIYDLPALGREEDAADQLGVVASAGGSDTSLMLIYVAQTYDEMSKTGTAPFWDEHALNQQRHYNILCWTYGNDPGTYSGLVEGGFLPVERANRCPNEWEQIAKSWDELLEPFLLTS